MENCLCNYKMIGAQINRKIEKQCNKKKVHQTERHCNGRNNTLKTNTDKFYHIKNQIVPMDLLT